MGILSVGGERVGILADAGRLIAGFIRRNRPIEFHDEAGVLPGRFIPSPGS